MKLHDSRGKKWDLPRLGDEWGCTSEGHLVPRGLGAHTGLSTSALLRSDKASEGNGH